MSGNDKMSCTIVCPGCPPSANVLKRKYRHPMAYKRLRDGWQRTIYALVGWHDRQWLQAQAKVGTKMLVTITLLHSRLYDADNAVAACKPLLDCLKRLEFIRNDDPGHLELEVEQQKIRANETWISIREAV